ncbi:MAG TPA: hypothetical protein VMZ71_04965, partial [Gemmataceae bacterium]|nr:hypothetical protein [Gemmataceae bacterium]
DPKFTVSKYLEKLISDEPYKSSVAARVVAGRFLLHREPENARTYINHALNVMPGGSSNPDALLVAAELALVDAAKDEKAAAEHLNTAKGYLEKAFSIDPKDIRIGILYADSLATAKERPKAIEVLRKSADALGEPNDQFLRVVDRLLDYGELEQSAKLIDKLETNDVDRVRIAKYFRGRLAVIKKDWGQARTLLEEVAPVLIRVPEFHKKALTDLAQCYGILQNPDKQLEHTTAALKDDPSYLPAVLANAEALSKLGRVREALPKYRLLVYAHRLETLRATLVRLEYLDTLMTPVGVRNWTKFEESLGPPEKRTPEINIVHAEALAARGNFDAANDLIKAVLKADPKNGPALMALARGGRGETRPEVILAGLEKARAEFGDSLEMRLAIAAVLPYRTKRTTPDEFRALAAGTGDYGTPALQRLWFALGEATMRAAGNNPDPKAAGDMRLLAVEFFEKSARIEPIDLVSRAILIDLGISTENPALIERSLKEIAGIEGDRGPIGTIGRVAARLPEVRKMDDKAARAAAVKELREDAKRVKGIRPAWPRIYIALAQLDEIEGLNDSALTNYMEAIDKGDRQEFVIRRMVDLYRERKEDDKATAVLNKLAAEINLPDDIERFRSIRNLLARDVPRDQRPTIERIAPLDSKDYRILLLRGALLAAIRADADAEVAFRAAVSVGDHVPDAWSALVTHLARQQKPEQAKAAIAEAEAKLRAKPNQTPAAKGEVLLTLAGCYEIVGDLKTAAERYQQAVEAAPQELSMHRQWVRFLQRHGQQAQAAELLKKMSESPAQDLARWGRRNLAMSLVVGRRAYSQRFAALNLIDQNLKADANDPEDVKARAVVQTIDPVTREEGLAKLREFAGRYELTPEEFYLLARMYFDQGKIAESLDYFTYAARPQPGVTLQHLSGLIRCHLALNRPDRAQDVLERMKTAAPASWEAARDEALVLSRRGTDAEKRGNATEAKKLREQARDRLLKYPGQRTEAFVTREIGPALEELGFLQDAELAYTQLMDKGTSPAPHLPLCVYLIMQKRTDQAIKLA